MVNRVAIAGVAALLVTLSGTARALQVGDRAPDFTLLDVRDQEHRLIDYRGKVVLIALAGYN